MVAPRVDRTTLSGSKTKNEPAWAFRPRKPSLGIGVTGLGIGATWNPPTSSIMIPLAILKNDIFFADDLVKAFRHRIPNMQVNEKREVAFVQGVF